MIKYIISDLGGVFLNKGIVKFRDKYIPSKYSVSILESKTTFLNNYKTYFSGKITEEKYWKNYLDELNIKANWMELREILLNHFKINKEVAKLYLDLKEKDLKLILLSDQTKEWWPILNKKYNINYYFDETVISAEIGLHKPNKEIYEYTLNKINAKPEECIFIDDLEKNLIEPNKLGIKTILFKNYNQLKKELNKLL